MGGKTSKHSDLEVSPCKNFKIPDKKCVIQTEVSGLGSNLCGYNLPLDTFIQSITVQLGLRQVKHLLMK